MQTPEIKRRKALGLKPRVLNNNHRKTEPTDAFVWQMLLVILGLLAIVMGFAH